MQTHKIVSRDEWLAARKALLAREKELTRQRDAVSAERRALPWVKVDKSYVFVTPEGVATLADLFAGRSQLAIYHFMLTPGRDHVCPGCSFLSDHVDAARLHFEHADLSFAAVSRAPLEQITPVKQRMGWRFTWVSSCGSEFNHDYGVSFTAEEIAQGGASYNYDTACDLSPDLPGISIFCRDGDGAVFHTYSSYARGGDLLIGAYNWLDLTPKGRNETATMDWLRLHDEYDAAPHDCCCGPQQDMNAKSGTGARQ
jgi:predicted dithiol-disulfide oxidoreductase (DUF899 family)